MIHEKRICISNELEFNHYVQLVYSKDIKELNIFKSSNKTPAKAFTPPAESKMGTRPGRAVTREFIERGVYSLISVLPN